MPGHELDRAIDGLARRQHGAFHRRQAVRIGFTRTMIETREDSGAWARLRGSQVFALPSHPGTWLRQCSAAVLSVPGSGLSGETGAALLTFPGYRQGPIEVMTKPGTTNRSPFARVRQSNSVDRFIVVQGIRVVSPADCLVQLAARLSPTALNDLTDDVARSHRSVLAELADLYANIAAARLPGIAAVRHVLEQHSGEYVPPDSELERVLRRVLASVPGLPPVDWQGSFHWLDRGNARVDGVLRDWRLIVEADGRDWHTRVRDFEHDRERDAVALANGYETLRLTWNKLNHHPVWSRNVLIAIGRHRSGSDAASACISA